MGCSKLWFTRNFGRRSQEEIVGSLPRQKAIRDNFSCLILARRGKRRIFDAALRLCIRKSTSGQDGIGHASRFNRCLYIMRSQNVRALEYEDGVRRQISVKPVALRRILSVFR